MGKSLDLGEAHSVPVLVCKGEGAVTVLPFIRRCPWKRHPMKRRYSGHPQCWHRTHTGVLPCCLLQEGHRRCPRGGPFLFSLSQLRCGIAPCSWWMPRHTLAPIPQHHPPKEGHVLIQSGNEKWNPLKMAYGMSQIPKSGNADRGRHIETMMTDFLWGRVPKTRGEEGTDLIPESGQENSKVGPGRFLARGQHLPPSLHPQPFARGGVMGTQRLHNLQRRRQQRSQWGTARPA